MNAYRIVEKRPDHVGSKCARRMGALFTVALISCFSITTMSADDGGAGALAVRTTVARGYVRPHDVNGKIKRETYVVNDGGTDLSPIVDGSFDHVRFDDVVKAAVPALRRQNYRPAKEVKDADLMIRIFWGTTILTGYLPPGMRQILTRKNAVLTGYEDDLERFYMFRGTALEWRSLTPMDELGDVTGRYYVILVAYDFQRWLKPKMLGPLWNDAA